MGNQYEMDKANSLIPHVHFINKSATIPLIEDDSDSYLSQMLKLENIVNTLIDRCNELIELNQPMNEAYQKTVSDIEKLQKDLDKFVKEFDIPNNSIGLEKLNSEFLDDLQNIIIEQVHMSAKFVTFGIDENGYFNAYIPQSWSSEVNFSTSENGELEITIRE